MDPTKADISDFAMLAGEKEFEKYHLFPHQQISPDIAVAL